MKLFIYTLWVPITLLLSSCLPGHFPQTSYRSNGDSYLQDFQQPAISQTPTAQATITAPQGYWDDEGVTGRPSIRISLTNQRAYFFKGRTLVGSSPISTGSEGHQTPKGRFKVTQKSIDHKSSLYGIIKDIRTGKTINNDADTRRDKAKPGQLFEHAPMPYFLRFNKAIGMHAGFLPGYPASHGCIRMPEKMAELFFKHSKVGTPVTVE